MTPQVKAVAELFMAQRARMLLRSRQALATSYLLVSCVVLICETRSSLTAACILWVREVHWQIIHTTHSMINTFILNCTTRLPCQSRHHRATDDSAFPLSPRLAAYLGFWWWQR
jgi:hypothetical protein